MPARLYLVIFLVLSLLTTPQAWAAVPVVDTKTMPDCPVMDCAGACCAQMACCVRSAQKNQEQPQTPSSQRSGVDLAPLPRQIYSFLYSLPVARQHALIRGDVRIPHSVPPLATTCIRLI